MAPPFGFALFWVTQEFMAAIKGFHSHGFFDDPINKDFSRVSESVGLGVGACGDQSDHVVEK